MLMAVKFRRRGQSNSLFVGRWNPYFKTFLSLKICLEVMRSPVWISLYNEKLEMRAKSVSSVGVKRRKVPNCKFLWLCQEILWFPISDFSLKIVGVWSSFLMRLNWFRRFSSEEDRASWSRYKTLSYIWVGGRLGNPDRGFTLYWLEGLSHGDVSF